MYIRSVNLLLVLHYSILHKEQLMSNAKLSASSCAAYSGAIPYVFFDCLLLLIFGLFIIYPKSLNLQGKYMYIYLRCELV